MTINRFEAANDINTSFESLQLEEECDERNVNYASVLANGSETPAPVKSNFLCGNEEEAVVLHQLQDAMYSTVDLNPTRSLHSWSEAVWDPNKNLARLIIERGKALSQLGGHCMFRDEFPGVKWLCHEEMLFLVEQRKLVVWNQKQPLSVRECYELAIDQTLSQHQYQAYAYLRRSGYHLRRCTCGLHYEVYLSSALPTKKNAQVQPYCLLTVKLFISEQRLNFHSELENQQCRTDKVKIPLAVAIVDGSLINFIKVNRPELPKPHSKRWLNLQRKTDVDDFRIDDPAQNIAAEGSFLLNCTLL